MLSFLNVTNFLKLCATLGVSGARTAGDALLSHLGQTTCHRVLLRANEAIDDDLHRHIHVVVANILPQVHARMRLGDSQDRLKVAHAH